MIRSQCSVICFKDVGKIKVIDIMCAFIYLKKNPPTLLKKTKYNICKFVYGKEVYFIDFL